MPNKKCSDLKDPVDREAAGVWVRELDIPDLTTRELSYVTEALDPDLSFDEMADAVMKQRGRKK